MKRESKPAKYAGKDLLSFTQRVCACTATTNSYDTKAVQKCEENMEKIKIIITAVISTLMSWLGILALPVLLLVGCNILDYFTGLCASGYRDEAISSYRGLWGIIKKVCMWLLIVVGAVIDALLNYAVQSIWPDFGIPYIVATVVAVWLVVNEIISILENMIDIGVEMPPFLIPLVKNIKRQVENKTEVEGENGQL